MPSNAFLSMVGTETRNNYYTFAFSCILFVRKKKEKVVLLSAASTLDLRPAETDVIKHFHLGGCFCSADTVERLPHPVKLLL